ncbi:hypothetical protein ASPBRDRAFT_34445 [Aspergillus brasiliensis CBS 101740]|uniref:Amine oxidase n=1 Tax=Aspergillus brasiliensis (strain CBS 101740 / IMI 381727 / IBT 21946) TaxID=767769 RepID=A0A1L9U6E9_ASPBC|nr:hypothetical protein ASPBRDRAFT_34445 [Aspergillus brasiliensis CBS 101740]
MSCHPLDPATAKEIKQATDLIKAEYSGISLHFKAAGLEEPQKAALVDFLDAEHCGQALPVIPRQIFVIWYIAYTPRLFEGIVDLSKQALVHHKELPRDFHGPSDRMEMNEVAQVVLKDPVVQAEIKRLHIDDTTVVLDPWDHGVDGEETQTRRIQVFMYMRNPANNDPDSSHYSFPLDFMVIVDPCKMEVTKVIRLPLGSDPTASAVGSEVPHRRTDPVEPEYNHRLQKNPPRTTLKPYHVIQPEGASFTVNGYLIEWEKWRFRVGFNWREGMTLHDVSFDGKSAFYRLSLSEMFVPYGLGLIKYLDGCVVTKDGKPAPRPNAICVHEIDNGIQWKHTNHRTGNATVVRKRQLVLQSIITVANYEYIFMWYFDQSGELTYETRATGILSTQPIDKDATAPWGTRVADGVMAPNHQHIFNLRIDPAVGGHKNSFASTDTVPLPWDEDLNPLGHGFVTQESILDRAGTVEDDVSKGRVFKILNENIQNPVSLTPIGYKLVPYRSQMLLARPGSWHWRRSEFCESPIWVTKYKYRQLFPSGDYTNQSLGGTGIKSWINESRDSVRNEDIVIWHTFGFTHNPRVEDFPVMPVEVAQVKLSPFNFCLFNPTNDVPPSTQEFNKSVEYTDQKSTVQESSGCCSEPKSYL